MPSQRQRQLDRILDLSGPGTYNEETGCWRRPPTTSSGWSWGKKDVLDNPPPMPKWKDPDRFDYRVLIPIYGFQYIWPHQREVDEGTEYSSNADISIISHLVKNVIDHEPNPDPKELNAAILFLCHYYFSDPAKQTGGHSASDSNANLEDTRAGKPSSYDYTNAVYSKALKNVDHARGISWDGSDMTAIRKVLIDHVKRGDKKARMLYEQMKKAGWTPPRDEIV